MNTFHSGSQKVPHRFSLLLPSTLRQQQTEARPNVQITQNLWQYSIARHVLHMNGTSALV